MNKVLVTPADLLDQDIDDSFLDRRSSTVKTAANSHDALATASVWQPQLIVFSSNLPGELNAVDFCVAVRREPALSGTRLLMLTDYIGEAGLDHVYSADTDAHLVSPVSRTQLIQTIGALLSVRERRSPRVPVQVLARLEGLAESDNELGKGATVANTINVSETGMRLESREHLAIGSSGHAYFSLPGSSQRLALPCTVRLLLDEILLHYAIEFQGADQNARNQLSAFVRGQLST